jgi:hypothetical protein
MLVVGKRLLARLGASADRRIAANRTLPTGPFVVMMLVMLVCAWFTDQIGIYSVFGAFIAGIAMPRGAFTTLVRERLEPVVAYVLLPCFFVFSGLNTNLNVLVSPALLGFLGLTLLVAFIGKGGSITIAGRLQGMDWYDSASLVSLMNARGLIELILLNIGLAAGIVTTQLYSILALMTILTTFVATPLHRWIQSRRPATLTDDELEAATAEPPQAVVAESLEKVADARASRTDHRREFLVRQLLIDTNAVGATGAHLAGQPQQGRRRALLAVRGDQVGDDLLLLVEAIAEVAQVLAVQAAVGEHREKAPRGMRRSTVALMAVAVSVRSGWTRIDSPRTSDGT